MNFGPGVSPQAKMKNRYCIGRSLARCDKLAGQWRRWQRSACGDYASPDNWRTCIIMYRWHERMTLLTRWYVCYQVSKSAAAATAALKKTLAAMSKESGSQTPSTSRQQPTPSTSVLKVIVIAVHLVLRLCQLVSRLYWDCGIAVILMFKFCRFLSITWKDSAVALHV